MSISYYYNYLRKIFFLALLYSTLLSQQGCASRHPELPSEVWTSNPVFHHDTPKLEHTFRVKNTTGRSVTILGERHTCGCTTAKYEAQTLAPAQSMDLKLVVEVPPIRTSKAVESTLLTDNKQFPEWTYRIIFQSFPGGQIEPGPIDVGTIQLGKKSAEADHGSAEHVTQAWLNTYSPVVATPTKIEMPAKILAPEEFRIEAKPSPSIDEPIRGVNRTRFLLNIMPLKERMSPGTFAREIAIELADGRKITTMLVWRVAASLAVSPSYLHFGSLRSGDSSRELTVMIRATDGRPFRILSTDGGSPSITVKTGDERDPVITAKMNHRIVIGYTVPGDFSRPTDSGIAIVRTDAQGLSEVKIPWSVFVGQRTLSDAKATRPQSKR